MQFTLITFCVPLQEIMKNVGEKQREQNGEVLGQKQAELELKELNGSCSSLISSRGQIDVKERCRDQKMKKGQN